MPIIPVFTQNIREAFRTIRIGQNFFRRVYERIKIPLVPIYGGFPVKLRTIIGKPILYDPSLSAEEVAQKVFVGVMLQISVYIVSYVLDGPRD